MEREVGGGIGMGNTCKPMAVSFQCMTKFTTNKKKKLDIKKKRAALNMSANLENLAMAPGLENVTFHSNPKEEQYQKMFKLSYNCAHFTY